MALTAKQQRFVDEYLMDLNATQAAIRAGYSAANADKIGSELLGKTGVRAAVEEAQAKRAEKVGVDAAWVLKRLHAEAQADIADIYDDNGNLLPVKEWPLIWRQGLVTGIEAEELFEGTGKDRKSIGYLRKVRQSDRIRRVELIGKHIGVQAFQENIKHSGLEGLADRVARAKKRTG